MPLAHTAHAAGGADALGWLLVVLLVLAPSLVFLNAARARRAAGRTWPSWRAASFVIGLVLAAAAPRYSSPPALPTPTSPNSSTLGQPNCQP